MTRENAQAGDTWYGWPCRPACDSANNSFVNGMPSRARKGWLTKESILNTRDLVGGHLQDGGVPPTGPDVAGTPSCREDYGTMRIGCCSWAR